MRKESLESLIGSELNFANVGSLCNNFALPEELIYVTGPICLTSGKSCPHMPPWEEVIGKENIDGFENCKLK